MTGDNLSALELGPQAQRIEQASNLRGLGIPEYAKPNRTIHSKGQPGYRPRDTSGGDRLR